MPLVFITGIFLAIPVGCSVSIEKSAASLFGAPLYDTSCFSLAAFKILSLSLNFASLVMICRGVNIFGFILFRILCASWTYVTFPLNKLGKFSVITLLNRYSILCSSSPPSGISDRNITTFLVVFLHSLKYSSFSLSLFSFFCSV